VAATQGPVLGGVRPASGTGLFATTREYGVAVMVLAVVATLGALVQRHGVGAPVRVVGQPSGRS
jgi:hypothetical protein